MNFTVGVGRKPCESGKTIGLGGGNWPFPTGSVAGVDVAVSLSILIYVTLWDIGQ